LKSLVRLILPANALVVMLGLIDLTTTVLWVRAGLAVEFNPVMAFVLRAGIPAFVLVKLVTLGSYVTVVEWYRRNRSERFARATGLGTLVAYLSLYVVSFCCVNHSFFLS
jgi:hypothetical protein